MTTDVSKVIVTTESAHSPAIQTTQVHHREFPEIRSAGENPQAAAQHLAHQLARALDTALTDWRRDAIQQAIADVQAFIDQGA